MWSTWDKSWAAVSTYICAIKPGRSKYNNILSALKDSYTRISYACKTDNSLFLSKNDMSGTSAPLLFVKTFQHVSDFYQAADTRYSTVDRCPREQGSWGLHGAHLGHVGPRCALCRPYEPYYQGCSSKKSDISYLGSFVNYIRTL